MKIFAEFFIQGLPHPDNPDPGLIGACGDRAIVRLDGRMSQLRMEAIAEEECRKRNYVAWQLIRGESLLRAKPFTKIVSLYY